MQTISSQRHLDDAKVEEKIAAGDYTVTVTPEFEIDGETYRVMIDGHHRYSAAVQVGAAINWVTADPENMVRNGQIAEMLEAYHHGDDYYNVETGENIW